MPVRLDCSQLQLYAGPRQAAGAAPPTVHLPQPCNPELVAVDKNARLARPVAPRTATRESVPPKNAFFHLKLASFIRPA